jgi:hypothetical protein
LNCSWCHILGLSLGIYFCAHFVHYRILCCFFKLFCVFLSLLANTVIGLCAAKFAR